MNSVWVFEKRAEDESNPSPRWEGVIIRYMHKSYTRFEDFRECYAKTSWNKVIHTMGKRGWELACIVTTPPSIQKGSLHSWGKSPRGGKTCDFTSLLRARVDIGPLESTPDRSIAQVPLPAEPPPTYAEAVAGDVTVLFSTSVTEALLPTGNAGPNNPLTTVHAAVQHTAPLPSTTVPTDRTHSAPGMVPRNVQTAANTANANSVPYQGGSANTVPPASDRIVPTTSNSVVNASTSVVTNASIPSSTRRTTDSSASAQGTADPSAQRNGNRGNQHASNHDGNASARPPPKPPRTLVEPGNRATRPLSGTLPANSTHTGSVIKELTILLLPTVQASNGFQAPPKPANRPENRKERERINTERGKGGNNLSARGENPREKSLEQNHGKHVHPPSRQGRQPPEGRYHATYRRPEENRARKATERENHRDHQTSATTRMTRYEKNRPVRREASKERSNHFSVVKGKDPVPKPKDLPDHWSHQSKFDGPQPAAGVSGHKDLAFNPAMVQKRRDRDYERVPGRNGENVGMKRSKDDMNFNHHQVRHKNDEITRAKFAEITNNRPVSGPSAQVKTFPQENTRFDQEPHGENKHPVISKTRQVQGGPDGVRKETSDGPRQKNPTDIRPGSDEKKPHHSDDETNPKTRSTPHNLPDLIRDKRSGDARQWVVKDLDVDEVFISSQVKPESQPQRGGHSPQVRQRASRNDGRTEQSVGRMFEASQVSQRLDLDMSDRRSLDSLQSFMDDQKRKPPEYDTVLAKRVVKPKPLKQSHNYEGPDIIEHTSRKGLPLQQSLPLQASNLPAKSKAPLPSYQQVIYSRSGARPKLKPSKSDQWSTDDTSRRPEVQRRQEDKRHQGPYERKVNEHDRLKNRQEIPMLRTTQAVDSYNQSAKQKPTLAPPPLERVSRSSVSPIGSVDSFDLISQWSQDDVEPPPSRLSKDLSGRAITGESTSSQADSVRGDYALVNDKRSYPVHSWDPGSSVGLDTEESVMGVKSSYWAAGGVRNSALDNGYSKPAPGTNLNCSQEKIIKSPSRTPSVSQRHVYIGKEIL
ncbi:hypothetical protein BSL78_29101 [Apostichopus japonicus]|uniref:Uncharacterized protein n=1 Tax=Stichopus japonicus TaxID=307972 RepID=A0A2G8JEC9_STIJA|nr:hypothetical protein BSL78_29101 [Apostichopus japonicus]